MSEPKEFHFHVYFHAQNSEEVAAALNIREKIIQRSNESKSYTAVPLSNVNYVPRDMGTPESFANVYGWMALNHGDLSVLVHPLTRYEKRDHTVHAAWLGQRQELNLSSLRDEAPDECAQYPELKMGYHAERNQ
ncbi:hypothetical protein PROFUN_04721 [Planoprotostelium fungivorum]|uniref:DOPA 4,5-dioxygenase n=1 Tax=Planoprotostelium fungivorum TaxID=1890364 RepID=A0A2P6NFX7_9EUKA|nr:hypothetical protein PROFUN_04721 [Planoprotostelium fungivorum]